MRVGGLIDPKQLFELKNGKELDYRDTRLKQKLSSSKNWLYESNKMYFFDIVVFSCTLKEHLQKISCLS